MGGRDAWLPRKVPSKSVPYYHPSFDDKRLLPISETSPSNETLILAENEAIPNIQFNINQQSMDFS